MSSVVPRVASAAPRQKGAVPSRAPGEAAILGIPLCSPHGRLCLQELARQPQQPEAAVIYV